ncbi:MAG: carboxymuconolactone decarboxylase family protein [candidate division NC10 bacterium]|nr:carboxymuconolactone decarboxylase family protein [candidate division NC10 bacterium]
MATRKKRAARQRPGRAEPLAVQIRRDRGYTYPEWEMASRLDPAFMEAYNGLYRRSLGVSHALPLKYRELVASALIAYRGEERSLLLHLRRARALGATEAEILDAFEATVMPGGALTLLRGLRALSQLRAEGRRRR